MSQLSLLNAGEGILLEQRGATMAIRSLTVTEAPSAPRGKVLSFFIGGEGTPEEWEEYRRKKEVYDSKNFSLYGTLYLTNTHIILAEDTGIHRFSLKGIQGYPDVPQISYSTKNKDDENPELKVCFKDDKAWITFSKWDLNGSAVVPSEPVSIFEIFKKKQIRIVARWVDATREACRNLNAIEKARVHDHSHIPSSPTTNVHGYCSKCGKPLAPNARFCRMCGAATSNNSNGPSKLISMNCPNCTAILARTNEPDTYYCSSCNSKFVLK